MCSVAEGLGDPSPPPSLPFHTRLFVMIVRFPGLLRIDSLSFPSCAHSIAGMTDEVSPIDDPH
jgi:hypothetical protein